MNSDETTTFEHRTRAAFDASVQGVEAGVRSRLTRARHAAVAAAVQKNGFRWARSARWAPAAGIAVAAVLAVGLWLNQPMRGNSPAAFGNQAIEDMELVASSDELELVQDDIEFYDWADKSSGQESGSVG
jgi:hypothetical protein